MTLRELRLFFIRYTPFTMAACNTLARLYYVTGELPTRDVWMEWDEYDLPEEGSIPSHAIRLQDTYLVRRFSPYRQNRLEIMATQSVRAS